MESPAVFKIQHPRYVVRIYESMTLLPTAGSIRCVQDWWCLTVADNASGLGRLCRDRVLGDMGGET